MKILLFLLSLGILFINSCRTPITVQCYQSNRLTVERVSTPTYQHITYLDTEAYGKVPCSTKMNKADPPPQE